MYPILFSTGAFHLYSLSIALVLSWLVFSFVFWQGLRSQGVEEERIFDLTFYSTVVGFIMARLVFVLLNFDFFRQSILKTVAIWVAPGMSLYGGILGALLTLIYLSRMFKVRVGYILDAFGPAYGAAFIIGAVGALLDGSYVGTVAHVPWAVQFVGHLGKRHPVELYEIIVVLVILLVMQFLSRIAAQKKWPYGILGLWFFALYSVSIFVLEFFKDTRVYFSVLRANQWILVALFAETIGAFYVRGGGREAVRPIANRTVGKIVTFIKGISARK